MKKLMLFCWLSILLTGVISLFWYNEWVYQLPTPVPATYKSVRIGENISLLENLRTDKDKPVFLHFFNPNCPCSRFNIDHFKSLVKEYGSKVNFVVVVMNND